MKRLAVFFLLPFLLWGCGRNRMPDGPMCRVVTEIRVALTADGHTTRRTYTGAREMESVMCYLRLLEKIRQVDIDPDSFRADSIEIIVFYSDGASTTYRQLHDQLLQIDDGPWFLIQKAKMELLFPES